MASKELTDHFIAFREQAIWLQNCQNICLSLFSADAETTKALRNTATHFFHDLSQIMSDYMVLLVGKITDPPNTGSKSNLTVPRIAQMLCAEGLQTEKALLLARDLYSYRAQIIDARNKIVAHADTDTFLTGAILGAHSEEDMHLFFRNLQLFCDEVAQAIGTEPLDFSVQAGKGDVLDLIHLLRKANKQSQL